MAAITVPLRSMYLLGRFSELEWLLVVGGISCIQKLMIV